MADLPQNAVIRHGYKVVVGNDDMVAQAYAHGLDLFLQDTLLDGAEAALKRVAEESAGTKLLTFVGLPFRARGKLYNCAAAVFDGRVLGLVPKTHIPNYSEFYEARHFSPAPADNLTVTVCGSEVILGTHQLFTCSTMKELVIGAEICEDLWVPSPPSQAHALAGATLLVNLSASDEVVLKDRYRRMLVASHSARLCAGYIYAAAGEGESDSLKILRYGIWLTRDLVIIL